MRKCAYVRVSTDKDEQAESLENQILHYAEIGITEDNIFADKGLTGTSLDRTSFRKMLRLCGLDIDNVRGRLVIFQSNRESKYDYIYCKSITRFSRNISEGVELVRALKKKKVYCKFEMENIDTKDTSSEFLMNMLLVMSQNESQQTSDRVRWGNVQTAKKGNLRSFFNYGYKRVDDHLEIVESEAEVVKKIYKYKLDGLGNRRIAGELNKEGYLTKKGKNWTESSIHNIVRNPIYMGVIARNRYECNSLFGNNSVKLKDESEWILTESDKVPAIISKEVFEKAQNMIKKHTMPNVKRGVNIGTSEFAKKILCGKCKSYYSRNINSNTKKVYYNCSNKKKNGVSACNSKNIYLGDIDKIINMFIGNGCKKIGLRLLNKTAFKKIDEKIANLKRDINKDNTKEIETNNQQISNLKEQLGKLVKLYINNTIPEDVLNIEKVSLEKEIKLLENKNSELQEGIDGITEKIKYFENIKNAALKQINNIPDNLTREEFIRDYLLYFTVKENGQIGVMTTVHALFMAINNIADEAEVKEIVKWLILMGLYK